MENERVNSTPEKIVEDTNAREELKSVNSEYKKRIIETILKSKFLKNYIYNPQLIFKPISSEDKDGWQEKPISESKEPLVAFNSFNNETKQILQLHL